jgi:hypothetical protein
MTMSKRLLIILLVPCLLILGGYMFLRFSVSTAIKKDEKQTSNKVEKIDTIGGKKVSNLDLRPLFIERLQQVLRKASNDLYDLSIGDLTVDVLASKISLQNVSVKPNSSNLKTIHIPDNVFTIHFKQLDIEGANLDDVITSKTMDYKLVRLINPVIEINHRKNDDEQNDEAFAERFLKEMKKLSIKKLVVEGATVIIRNNKKEPTKLNNVSVNMNDILIDSATRKDRSRFLFAKNAVIHFENYIAPLKGGVYNLKVDAVTLKAPQQQVVLQDVSLTSPYNKIAFTQKQKKATEWYHLTIPAANINGINWWRLLNEEEVMANAVRTQGGKLMVYFDRNLPARSKMGNFPNQILQKLPIKLSVQKMHVQNLDLSYQEVNPVNKQSGTIYMDNVVMDINNLSNQNAKPVTVNGTALFMHRIPIKANFNFNMNNKSGAFGATISTHTPFNGDMINSFAEPLGLVRLDKGTLQQLDARMNGNENGASGNVTVLYNDLKLTLLEKNKADNGMNKKHITSLFANAFVLKEDNPKKGKEVRKETASFQRDPNGGFFMLIWKTILVGALKTIGAPEKIAYKKSGPQ